MTYAKPMLQPIDLGASQACCGIYGGACQPPPSNPYDSSGGLLGCYYFGTC